MRLTWRKIRFRRLLASGLVYRLFIVLVQTLFLWPVTGEFRLALGASAAWNLVNMGLYYLFHTVLLKTVKFGKD